jgi:hypothetical protein
MKLPRAISTVLASIALAGCMETTAPGEVIRDWGPSEIFASPGRSLEVSLGQELRLTIRTIGPGNYASPPEMAGTSLTFIDSRFADVQVPAGPTQVYRFLASARGTTIVRFHNTYSDLVVADTVRVN